MNKAQRRAVELRCKLGLCGQVDAEGVANILGYQVVDVAMRVQKEMSIGRFIAVAEYLEPDERRWVIAHALAHKLMHPGNHLQIHKQTRLGHKIEREAEDFTGALLMECAGGGGGPPHRDVGRSGALRGAGQDGPASAALAATEVRMVTPEAAGSIGRRLPYRYGGESWSSVSWSHTDSSSVRASW